MDNTNILFERAITKDFLGKERFNQVLLESDNFIVIPSLGSLVEGWLLIVPKMYALSMGQLPSSLVDELEEMIQRVSSILIAEYGCVIAFEHGAAISNTVVGCGVDYAHMHLLPVTFNLIQDLEDNLNIKYEWNKVSSLDIAAIYAKQNIPYLYVRSSLNDQLISSSNNIPSQLFRRVIANHIGKADEFDWKAFPNMENVEKTISRLSKYSDSSHTATLSYGRRNK